MNKFWRKIMFRKNRNPRKWVRSVIFRREGTVRPLFDRVVHKKSGAVRPHFAYWATSQRQVFALQSEKGQPEATSDPLSPAEETLRNLRTPDVAIRNWKNQASAPQLMSADEILNHSSMGGDGLLVLSASHDNYREILGGVQLCLQREEDLARERGMTYLQFHPWQPLPFLADPADSDDYLVTLVCDGAAIGTARISSLIEAVASQVGNGRSARLVVHHLLGHAPEAMTRLAKATGGTRTLFWLHDFFSLCPSYTLQRNTLKFCGAPDATSNACSLCVFGKARPDHQARIAAFFAHTDVTVVSPSEVTATFWADKSDLPHSSLEVVPHLSLTGQPQTTNAPGKARALTVGYLGAPVEHKGWPTFSNLMYELRDEDIRFVVLSDKRPNLGEDDWRRVCVTTKEPDAMMRAVTDYDIDLVVHWASWPETFSFTTFEAMAGGAYVLTNPVSGNVRAAVETSGRGAGLADESALVDFFRTGQADQLAQKRRAAAASTKLATRYSDLSFSVPDWI